MNLEDMILVSVDDHIVEPPDMWDEVVPAKYKDRAPRFVQKARGYEATVVSGEVTFRNGEHTGALPGRLVRGAQSA